MMATTSDCMICNNFEDNKGLSPAPLLKRVEWGRLQKKDETKKHIYIISDCIADNGFPHWQSSIRHL